MEPNVDARVATPVAAPPQPEKMVAVQLELSQAEAEQLRALGGSAWVCARLAEADGRPAGAREPSDSDYLVGLAQALFPLPVSGSAVRLVDVLRKQGMVEAAVTYDDGRGEGDRAIVVDITSLGRAEIERLRRMR
ncbi:hypothetical protein GCM10007320_00360 [Pseudorhodoferax aquiterrae]|uniref:Uncharacterized protein n=1 Tax=Pseudorhodoferax aquiterrae TaxID=747304 RepID=A0ABQ3FVE7_9BURK|nr:hypothetical protein [Pseudorhodoferax aquiterrae]GHC68241.1 hypothetical protein GCM10007320_00360 [Pseudorhodoferax aquiterrae]